MNKNNFILYHEQREIIDQLTDNQAGKLFKAIFQYSMGEEPKLSKTLSLVFVPIRQMIDRNKENYEKVCEINSRNAKKRWKKIPTDAKTSDGMRPHAKAYEQEQEQDNDIAVKKLSSLLGNSFKVENNVCYRNTKKGWTVINSPSSYLKTIEKNNAAAEIDVPENIDAKTFDYSKIVKGSIA